MSPSNYIARNGHVRRDASKEIFQKRRRKDIFKMLQRYLKVKERVKRHLTGVSVTAMGQSFRGARGPVHESCPGVHPDVQQELQ